MNKKEYGLWDFSRSFISLFIAVIMIFNLTGQSVAQVVSYSKHQLPISSQDLEKILEKKVVQAQDNTRVHSNVSFQTEIIRINQEAKQKDPLLRQLESLKEFFFPFTLPVDPAPQPAYRTFAEQRAEAVREGVSSMREFIQIKYDEALKNFEDKLLTFQAKQMLASIPDEPETPSQRSERVKYIEADMEKIRQSFLERLADWKKESLEQLEREEKATLANAKDRYAQARQQLDGLREKIVLEKKNELLALYRQNPAKARPYLISIASHILSYRNSKGESFFTQQEKDFLADVFIKYLSTHDGCINKNSSNTCELAFAALSGLGVAGTGSLDDVACITDFVERHLSAPGVAGPVLLAGSSALLMLAQPGAVGGILNSAVQREHNTVFPLSFTELYDFTKYHTSNNQKYLGDVSKAAQFVGADGTVSNGWEELALMLAAEGSKESLHILREYGVGRCRVMKQDDQFSIRCDTILPFLVGALYSGKSGADTYTPASLITRPGQYISNLGAGKGIVTVTQEEASKAEQIARQGRNNLKELSQLTGLPPAAIFSRYLFLSNMADLNAEEELAVDNKLYSVFSTAITGREIKDGYKIEPYEKGDPAYVLKRSAYDRSKWWGTLATAGDVGLLVWFGVDVVRYMPKAARWVKLLGNGALASVGKMASNTRVLGNLGKLGDAAPLMEELTRLRPQWTKNFTAKITSRLEGIVQAQMPQFATVEFATQRAWKQTEWSKLLNQVKIADGSVFIGEGAGAVSAQASGVQKTLADMSSRVNERFMHDVFSWKNRFLPKDYLYRQLWRKEIYSAVPQGTNSFAVTPQQRFMFELAGAIRGNSAMKVPTKLNKTISLLHQGKVNNASLLHEIKAVGIEENALTEVSQILGKAVDAANKSYQYRNRFWKKIPFGDSFYQYLGGNSLYRQLLGKKVGVFLEESKVFTQNQKIDLTERLAWQLRRDYSIKAPKQGIVGQTVVRKPAAEYEARAAFLKESADEAAVPLPLTLRMDARVNGVSDRFYQRVDFLREPTGEYTLTINNAADKPFKLENFKILAPEKELSKLALAAQNANEPIALTMSPYAKTGFLTRTWNDTRNWLEGFSWFPQSWRRGKDAVERSLLLQDNRVLASRTVFSGDKEERFSSILQVARRLDDGSLSTVPLTVKADKFFGMANLGINRMVIEPNRSITFLNEAGNAVSLNKPFFFGIPKGEAGHLAQALRNGKVAQPLSLKIEAKKSGLWRMYVATGLSLSSASTGLLASLEEFYPSNKPYGASDTDKMMITLFFPFVPSLLAPVFTPFVKRAGALNVTKAALAISTSGLAVAIGSGFVWNTPQNKYSSERPKGLPDYGSLYVSALAIGISSALLRASLNTLIGKASGSTGLVKSMLAKNIGSAALLVPPLVFGGLYSEDGNGLVKKAPTFASSFPVLGAGSLAAFLIMHYSSINRTIGREKGFKFNLKTLVKESAASYKLVFHPAMLSMMGGAFMLTGFESAAYNKATNQSLKSVAQTWASSDLFDWNFMNFNQEHQKKNLTATFTGGALLIAPFLARWKAGPILNLFGTDEKVRYTRMLQYSLASSAIGGGLLLSVDGKKDGSMDALNWAKFIAGGTLLGLGTANVFQSLQNLATARYMGSAEVTAAVKKASSLKEQKRVKDVYKATSRTVFSAANVGMALPPLVVSSSMDYLKNDKRPGGARILDEQVPSYSLGMSYAFLGAGAAISLGGLGVLKGGMMKSLMRGLSWPVTLNAIYKWGTRPAATASFGQTFPTALPTYQEVKVAAEPEEFAGIQQEEMKKDSVAVEFVPGAFPVQPKPLAPFPRLPVILRK